MAERIVIDCNEATHANARKLGQAAEQWAKEKGRSFADTVEYVLYTVLRNGKIYSEVEESIVVGLARTFGCEVENIQFIENE